MSVMNGGTITVGMLIADDTEYQYFVRHQTEMERKLAACRRFSGAEASRGLDHTGREERGALISSLTVLSGWFQAMAKRRHPR